MKIEKSLGIFGRSEKGLGLVERVYCVNEKIRRGEILVTDDIDGSEVQSSKKAIEIFNQQNGTHYRENDLRIPWGMTAWAHQLGINEPRKYTSDLWNSDLVMRTASPVGGACDLAKFLITFGNYKIEIPRVTARPVGTRNATLAWYRQWMPWHESPEKIIFMQTGSLVNPKFKVEKIAELGPTYHFDDQAEDAEAIVKASPGTTVILVPQSWNEDYQVPDLYRSKIIKAGRLAGLVKLTAYAKLVELVLKT